MTVRRAAYYPHSKGVLRVKRFLTLAFVVCLTAASAAAAASAQCGTVQVIRNPDGSADICTPVGENADGTCIYVCG